MHTRYFLYVMPAIFVSLVQPVALPPPEIGSAGGDILRAPTAGIRGDWFMHSFNNYSTYLTTLDEQSAGIK